MYRTPVDAETGTLAGAPQRLTPLLADNLDVVPSGFTRTANTYCPVMQKTKLKPHTPEEDTVEFDGVIIGFCCEDCRAAWGSMSDEERRARVKAVAEKK